MHDTIHIIPSYSYTVSYFILHTSCMQHSYRKYKHAIMTFHLLLTSGNIEFLMDGIS